jgi:hypothetical protein
MKAPLPFPDDHTVSQTPAKAWGQLIDGYVNTAEHNDALHAWCTVATRRHALLHAHREHVERHRLGFGDAAFHTLWRLLLHGAAERFGRFSALEIGVYKGQVISLWQLLVQNEHLTLDISAITPLQGNPPPHSLWRSRWLWLVSPRYRERVRNGDFYPEDDYATAIAGLFAAFALDLTQVRLLRGFSTDNDLKEKLAQAQFHVVYVDGAHTYDGVRHDLEFYGTRIVPGGWLVVDDAGCDLPGTSFWKGHPAVTRACDILPGLHFHGVLNVGHNRVFERQPH